MNQATDQGGYERYDGDGTAFCRRREAVRVALADRHPDSGARAERPNEYIYEKWYELEIIIYYIFRAGTVRGRTLGTGASARRSGVLFARAPETTVTARRTAAAPAVHAPDGRRRPPTATSNTPQTVSERAAMAR